LFVESGYPGTTVDAIATEAGVAVATVYKAFGTKAAIARELNDLIDEEAAVVCFAERIAVETEIIVARALAGPASRASAPTREVPDDHSHVRCPRLDNELGAMLVAAGLGMAAEHAPISLLALNGLRVSRADAILASCCRPGLGLGWRPLQS
jgi:AcrR family transcriptional regulator